MSKMSTAPPPSPPPAAKPPPPPTVSIYEMYMSQQQQQQEQSPLRPLTPSPSSSNTTHSFSPETALHRPVPMHDDNNGSHNPYSWDNITRRSQPYMQVWKVTPPANEPPPDFSWLTNSCGGKAVVGVIGGGAMGLLMGVFLGAMSDATPPVMMVGGKDVPQAPLREQMRLTLRATADKSLYWCRNFAFITGVFGGSECLVEKYRGKHDVWNSVASGCLTGAALQAKQGPQAAAIGCGGFAAFSLVIDSFMGHY